jgi:hypothetical protein
MKTNRFSTKLQSGKINLSTKTAVGNGTVKVSSTPFPLRDTLYYQVDAHGDYTQEVH